MQQHPQAWADYQGLIRELAKDEPHVGWHFGALPRLTDAQYATILAANPEVHEDALSEMYPSLEDVIDAMRNPGAMNAWALVGTAYRVMLTKYLHKQLLRDLDDFSESRDLEERPTAAMKATL